MSARRSLSHFFAVDKPPYSRIIKVYDNVAPCVVKHTHSSNANRTFTHMLAVVAAAAIVARRLCVCLLVKVE